LPALGVGGSRCRSRRAMKPLRGSVGSSAANGWWCAPRGNNRPAQQGLAGLISTWR
jgi:hypothetical protein